MLEDIESVLIDQPQLQRRLVELGEQLTQDYQGRDLLLVGVLKGAVVFLVDLARSINMPLEFDFMAISSYGASTRSSGVVRILKDLDESIEGKDVLIVEDIIDTGLTIKYIMENLATRNPASLQVCTLLDKQGARQVEVEADYVGFQIPNRFVVGYGLDYAERYRNLPYIGVLKPAVYGG